MRILVSAPRSLSGSPRAGAILSAAADALPGRFFCASDPPHNPLGSGGGSAHLLHQYHLSRVASPTGSAPTGGFTHPSWWRDAAFQSWLASSREQRVLVHAGGHSRRLPAYSALGKALLPLPHEEGGLSRVGETLLSSQLPLYETLLDRCPPALTTIIACGDVWLSPEALPSGPSILPPEGPQQSGRLSSDNGHGEGVDVLCLGMPSSADAVLARHGVLLTAPTAPSSLVRMLQKPSLAQLHACRAAGYDTLLDVGLWLLSPRALVRLASMAGQRYNSHSEDTGGGGAYDLYGDFGMTLGSAPPHRAKEEEEENTSVRAGDEDALTVRVLPLLNATTPSRMFRHYGSSRDLLRAAASSSSSSTPPPPPPHPMWEDNCTLGPGWSFSGNHILTGVSGADWRVHLRPGECVDVVPLQKRTAGWVCRPYGVDDTFRGAIAGPLTTFLGRPLCTWLEEHHVPLEALCCSAIQDNGAAAPPAPSDDVDIYEAHLFPRATSTATLSLLLRWMLARNSGEMASPAEWAKARAAWLHAARYTAAQLTAEVDASLLMEERARRHRETARQLLSCLSSTDDWRGALQRSPAAATLWASADLLHLAGCCAEWQLPPRTQLPPVVSSSPSTSDPITSSSELLEEARRALFVTRCHTPHPPNTKMVDPLAAARPSLRAAVAAALPLLGPLPHPRLQRPSRHQRLVARAPARIDLSGGWTDTPPYPQERGGRVVNMAVTLDGRKPIQVYVQRAAAPYVTVRSMDCGGGAVHRLVSYEDLRRHLGPEASSPSSRNADVAVLCGALALAGLLPEYAAHTAARYPTLTEQLEKDFHGCGVEITTSVAIPAGSGLGTSSILAGAALAALGAAFGLGWSTAAVCDRVLLLEQLLGTGGGWQDAYGGLLPGVKALSTTQGWRQQPQVTSLPTRLFDDDHRAEHVLFYTGCTRSAGQLVAEMASNVLLRDRRTMRVLQEMATRQTASLQRAITAADMADYGRLVGRAWRQQLALSPRSTIREVDALLEAVKGDVRGAKLAGAGGGGFLYLVAKDAAAAARVRAALTEAAPSPQARLVDLAVCTTGLEVCLTKTDDDRNGPVTTEGIFTE